MLFPLVKTLFPASAQAVDSVLDPQRHKGVDALHARVGRQLQQLHDRHRAGEEMVQDSDEMRNVRAPPEGGVRGVWRVRGGGKVVS